MKRYLVTVTHGSIGPVKQEVVETVSKAHARAWGERWIDEDGWMDNNRSYLKISVGVAR